MKIFDCTTFFNENLMLEIRFNVLNDFVDKFVITEAKYSHSGDKKRLNFNYNRFREFKKKIDLTDIIKFIKNDDECLFSQLTDITAVDYPEKEERFEIDMNELDQDEIDYIKA